MDFLRDQPILFCCFRFQRLVFVAVTLAKSVFRFNKILSGSSYLRIQLRSSAI